MRILLKSRVLQSLVFAAVLFLIEVLVVPFIPLFYFATLVVLELLENRGLRTLTGSPDGWPAPTDLGLTIAVIGWFLVDFAVAAVFIRVINPAARNSMSTRRLESGSR